MPYTIKKEKSGYRVHSPKGPKSEKPMSKAKALKQQAAIYANAKKEDFDSQLDAILESMDQVVVGWDEVSGEWYAHPDDEEKYAVQDPNSVDYVIGTDHRNRPYTYVVVFGNPTKVQQIVKHFDQGLPGDHLEIRREMSGFISTLGIVINTSNLE